MKLKHKSGAIGLVVGLVVGGLAVGAAPASAFQPADPEPTVPIPIHSLRAPARLFDSRPGEKTVDGTNAGGGRLAAGSITKVQVAGRAEVPANATAVFLNLTSVVPAGPSLLTAYGCTDDVPTASTLNSPPNDVRANGVFVDLSDSGSVCIYTVAATDLVIDITGYVPIAADNMAVEPARIFESRIGESTIDGESAGVGKRAADSVTEIKVAGRAGVPDDATAAFLNLTSVFPDQQNLLTIFPCDESTPKSSSVNSPPGDIRANGAFVKLSKSGTVCVYTVKATDFLVDVTGFVPAVENAVGVAPARLFESRPGETTVDGTSAGVGRRRPGSITEVQITGRAGVPMNARAAFVNLTSVDPSDNNYLSAFPCDAVDSEVDDSDVVGADLPPMTSTLNSPPGDTRANGALVKLSSKGTLCVYTVARTDFLVDVNGYVARNVCDEPGPPVPLWFDSIECEALLALYNSTGGAQWTNNSGWAANSNPCTWYGVRCSGINVVGLDLQNNNLNGPLPAAIGDLSRLSTLDLGGNNVRSLPPEIGKLANLSVLSLYGNRGPILPSELGNLTNLTTLNLGSNAEWGPRVEMPFSFAKLTKLTNLNLSFANLRSLPPGLERATGLTTLLANGNTLATIPPEIGQLTNLTYLDLNRNVLTSLPPSIGQLAKLTVLNVGDNKLSSLPAEIGQLKNLIELNAITNSLSALPPEIGGLTSLTTLRLERNQLTELPATIGDLAKLNVLNLAENNLASVPPEIAKLTELTYFDVGGSPIGTFPAGVETMTKLETLSLVGTGLTSVPASIGNLTSLKTLNLSGNALPSLPTEIDKLTNLEALRLSFNYLTAVPPEIEKFTNLQYLELDHNQIVGDINAVFEPLRVANKLVWINLRSNGCMTLTDPALLAWHPLSSGNSGWDSGC